MGFVESLPPEVLDNIADHLKSYNDLLRFAQTNRRFSQFAIRGFRRLLTKEASRILHQASQQGRVDILHRAAQSGVSLGDFSLALTAAQENHIKVLDVIAESRGEEPFNAEELSKLVWAACSWQNIPIHFNMLSHLFNRFGASLNPKQSECCLHQAIKYENTKFVQLLLDKGVDPSAEIYDRTPLEAAVNIGSSDITNILLENGANIHVRPHPGDTLLHIAARSGHVDVLKILLKHGADPSVTLRGCGSTPLKDAIVHEKRAAACLLMQKTTNHGASMRTLFSALRHGATITLAVLHLKAGVARAGLINTRDYAGRTVLFIAARQGNPKMVQQFLAHEADPCIADDFGTTLIFAAARNGHIDVVRQLLAVDPGLIESTDNLYGGHSLLYWAQRSGNDNLVNLLRRAIELAGLEDPIDARGQSTASNDAPRRQWKIACDLCARRLPAGDVMQCRACYDGDFYMCPECYSHAKCLDESHQGRYWRHHRASLWFSDRHYDPLSKGE
ncbi:Ankyrin repeat-containing domain protein, partial [Metarhizium hybridum]